MPGRRTTVGEMVMYYITGNTCPQVAVMGWFPDIWDGVGPSGLELTN